LNRIKDKSILKGEYFDDVWNMQPAVDAVLDSWAEAAKKLNFAPASQPKENITPSEKQPQEPKQTIELWSVWQRTGTDGIFVVTKKTNEFFPRVGLWNITMSQYDDLYFFSDFKRDFTPRPDLEVVAPYLFVIGDKLISLAMSFITFEESKNTFDKPRFYKWPASLAQMIVVEKGK